MATSQDASSSRGVVAVADIEEVRSQAKRIMDDFLQALESADLPDAPLGVEREETLRVPNKTVTPEAFVERILANAPRTKDRCILAEKKTW